MTVTVPETETGRPPDFVGGKAVALPLPTPDGKPWQAPPPQEPSTRWYAYTAFGVAAAAAAAAAVFGALALWSRSQVDGEVIHGDADRERVADSLEMAELHARTADLLGIAALVAAGTGLWLWPEALATGD